MKTIKIIVYILTLNLFGILVLAPPTQIQAAPSLDEPAQFSCTNVTEIPQIECEALVALYNGTDGPNWQDNTDWLVTNTPCDWYGLVCELGQDHIIIIWLSGSLAEGPFGLQGDLPSEIGNFSRLTTLRLAFNNLTSVPSSIGNLNSLTYLELESNQLNSLPSSIGNLTNLTDLDLLGNRLSSLPTEISNLNNLTELYLDFNQFSRLPSSIKNLNNLTWLSLAYNELDSVSGEIGDLRNLTTLFLSNNNLSKLPSEIGNLNNLTGLFLSDNNLNTLPASFVNLNKLTSLNLSNNRLNISNSNLRFFITERDPDWAANQLLDQHQIYLPLITR